MRMPPISKFGETNVMTLRMRPPSEDPPSIRSPRTSKPSTANNTPRHLKPLHTPGTANSGLVDSQIFSPSDDFEDTVDDIRRRYHLGRTNLIKVEANGSTCKPLEILSSEGTFQSQVDSKSQQREYLRMYYSDFIGQRTVEKPLFPPESDTWEVDALCEFLSSCRPRTRIDAYPLLLITQDVLRRMSEKEIKLVNSKTHELAKELANVYGQLDQSQRQCRQLESILESKQQELDSIQRDGKTKLQREKLSSIMQKGLQSTVQNKNLEKINKHQSEISDLHHQVKYLAAQVEEKNDLLQKAEDDFQSHLKQQASRKPLEIFMSWQNEDRRAVILFALSDSTCLHSVGGLDRCLDILSKHAEPLRILKSILKKEIAESDDRADLIKYLQEVLEPFVHIETAEVETQTDPPQQIDSDKKEGPASRPLDQSETGTFTQLVASMTDLNHQLDQKLDSALHLNEDFNTEELSVELLAIKVLVRQLSRRCADIIAFKPQESPIEEKIQLGQGSSSKALENISNDVQESTRTLEVLVPDETMVLVTDEINHTVIEAHTEQEIKSNQAPDEDSTVPKQQKNYVNVRLHEVSIYKRQLSKDCKAMPIDQCLRVIHEAYQTKLIQDVKDDATTGRKRQAFDSFFKDFLVRKYGLRSIATKQLCSIAMCIEKESSKNARIKTFGEIAGFIDGPSWTPLHSDFALGVLNRVCDFEGRDSSGVGEWLDSNGEPGVTVQAAVHAMKDMSLSGPIPFQEIDVNSLCALPKNSSGNVIVERLILWCMDFFRQIQQKRKNEFMALFEAYDKNGDGVLDFQEFEALIKAVVQSDTSLVLDRQDIFQMYHEALKDDAQGGDRLSKDAFADLMLRRGFKYSPKR